MSVLYGGTMYFILFISFVFVLFGNFNIIGVFFSVSVQATTTRRRTSSDNEKEDDKLQ